MKRVPQLDGLRGVAILLVLMWHYLVNQFGTSSIAAAYMCLPLSLSWSGVDLFFVLSGFLIVGILLDHRTCANYFQVFYLRRACRILPLYFLMLGIFVCLSATSMGTSPRFVWLFKNPMPLWSYASLTQNFLMGQGFGANWLGVTWSLAIEEQFYLVIPLLVRFFPHRILALLFLVMVLLAPLLRFVADAGTFYSFVSTPCRADSLLGGACLALLIRSPGLAQVIRYSENLRGALLFFLMGAAVLTLVMNDPMGSLVHLWLSALYCTLLLLVLVEPDSRVSAVLKSPALVWLGHISFGVYLFHQPVSGLIYGFIRGGQPAIRGLADFGLTALALATTLLVASLSYRFLETPLLRFAQSRKYACENLDALAHGLPPAINR